MTRFLFVTLSLLLALSIPAAAEIIHVPGDYPTIQQALDAAGPGDVIQVAPGTYFEVFALKENVSLVGSGFESTIIDGGGVGDVSGSVIRGAENSLISGFTIRNANLSPINNSGVCIAAGSASMTIRENRLTNCRIGASTFGPATIERNLIVDNPGLAGIFVGDGSSALVHNNTIVNSGRGVQWSGEATPEFVNNIITNNGIGIAKFGENNASIRHNDVFGNDTNYFQLPNQTGRAGNISANPRFVAAASGDYNLQINSPCIDAGDPDSPVDPDGTVADIGAFFFDFDAGDTPQAATQISLPHERNYTLDPIQDDVHWFRINLEAGQRYLFETSSSSDLRFGLYGPGEADGSEIGMLAAFGRGDSPYAIDRNPSIVYTPTDSGFYYLRVASLYSGFPVSMGRTTAAGTTYAASVLTAVRYTLTVRPVESDGNDIASSATQISLPHEQGYTIDPILGDVDWYRVSLEAGQRYLFETYTYFFDHLIFHLYGPGEADGSEIGMLEAFGDNVGGWLNPPIDYIPAESGFYYLRVAHINNTPRAGKTNGREETMAAETGATAEAAAVLTTFEYTLSIRSVENDGNNMAASAAQISLPHEQSYTLDPSYDDVDWYRISLETGQRYVFETRSSGDLMFILFGPGNADGSDTGELAAFDDDSGLGLNPVIVYTPADSGFYYLRVAEYGNFPAAAAGKANGQKETTMAETADATSVLTVEEYTLTIHAVESDGNDIPVSATQISLPHEQTYALDPIQDDLDWYRVNLEAGQRYLFETSTWTVLILHLYGPGEIDSTDADMLAAFDDSRSEANRLIDYTPTESGLYYLRVAGYGHFPTAAAGKANGQKETTTAETADATSVLTAVEYTLSARVFTEVTTSSEEREVDLPDRYVLAQNYPNPFNPVTTITFALPQAGGITLKVFDVLGREVAVLASGDYAAGRFETVWDASGLPSGIYVYRLEADNYVETRQLVLQK